MRCTRSIDVDYTAVDEALQKQDYTEVKRVYTSGTEAGFSLQSLSTNLGQSAVVVDALKAPGTSTGSFIRVRDSPSHPPSSS